MTIGHTQWCVRRLQARLWMLKLPVHVQILEGVIKFKWAALPAEQREGIKNYVSNIIIKYSTNEALYRRESTFMNKLNVILVQILKQVSPLSVQLCHLV